MTVPKIVKTDRLISHRANITGSDPKLENNPKQIIDIITEYPRLDVEIDVRYIDDNWYLGHDEPQYKVTLSWLANLYSRLFIHAKDSHTLFKLISIDKSIHQNNLKRFHQRKPEYFVHDSDKFTFTSNRKYLWHYPGDTPLTNRSIAVMPERVENWQGIEACYAICTDYVLDYSQKYNILLKPIYK